MQIEPFAVEQWMNAYEDHCQFNLAETCVESLTVKALLDLAGVGRSALDDILDMKLTYGAIVGSERLRISNRSVVRRCGHRECARDPRSHWGQQVGARSAGGTERPGHLGPADVPTALFDSGELWRRCAGAHVA